MKNTVLIIITENELLRPVVTFECKGNIWEWLKSNDNSAGYLILESVRDKEVKTFFYELHLNNYLDRLKNLKGLEVVDERKTEA